RPDLGEDREGLAEVGGSVVLEGWWFHEIEGFPWSGVAFSSSLRLGNSLLSAGLLAGAARRRDGLLAALLVAQVRRGDEPHQVVRRHGDDRAERDAGEFVVLAEHQLGVTDGDDDARGDRDQVDRVAEVVAA